MSVVTLLSGGLDSAVLAKIIADERESQFPLFVDYGQRSADREWHAACGISRKLRLQEIERMCLRDFGRVIPSGLTNMTLDIVERAFLPGRNTLFLLCGAAYGVIRGCNAVGIGLLSEANSLFPDQTSKYLRHVEDLLCLAVGKKLKIIAPLMTLDKASVIRIAKELAIEGTYSCHAGGETPCGVCISCQEFISKE